MSKAILIIFAVIAMIVAPAASIPGGAKPEEANDPGVVAAANFVLEGANQNQCHGLCAGLRNDGELKLVKVTSASSQVVAGILYKLELLMADSNGKQVAVSASVWDRPWLMAKNDAANPATQITALTYQRLGGSEA